MTGERQPNPGDDALLADAAAEALANDAIYQQYADFVRSARANEEPFRLSSTQRWAAVGGCLVFFTWGVNALAHSSDTPKPIGTVATPQADQSPSTEPTSPLNKHRGAPISGKGGAPTFEHFGD
jgi:hypothetical protein